MVKALLDHGLGLDPTQPVFVVQPLSGRATRDLENLAAGGYHVHRNPKRKQKRPTVPTAQEHPDSLAEAMEGVTEKEGK